MLWSITHLRGYKLKFQIQVLLEVLCPSGLFLSKLTMHTKIRYHRMLKLCDIVQSVANLIGDPVVAGLIPDWPPYFRGG